MHKKSALAAVMAVCVLVAGGSVLLGAGTTTPATATFRDTVVTDVSGLPLAGSDRLRSDNSPNFAAQPPYPSYQDPIDCVKSQVGSGFSFRSRSYSCTTSTPTATPRSVTLDFSQPVVAGCTSPTNVTDAFAGGTLDICGSNAVPDVRIIASGMFASTAATKGTSLILVFSTPTNFTGPGGFELDFEQNVGVTVVSGTARQMTAPATAIAQLYQNVSTSGKKISLGRYYMPFSLTVVKQY